MTRSPSRRSRTTSATRNARSTSWPRAPARRLRRNEDRASERFARLDAEIAALKDKFAGLELTQLMSRDRGAGGLRPRRPTPPACAPRSSSSTAAHHNSVAAITRRLDRIEVKVGALDRCHRAGCQRRTQDNPPRRQDETAANAAAFRSGRVVARSTAGTCSTSSR